MTAAGPRARSVAVALVTMLGLALPLLPAPAAALARPDPGSDPGSRVSDAAGVVLAGPVPVGRAAGPRATQRRLNALGCDAGRPDGRLDRQVRSAVIRLQSRHGLRQTGRLDPTTRRTLGTTTQRCDVRPVPTGSGEGRRLVISQQQNWVWLVTADGRVRAQGGMVDDPSLLSPGRYVTGSYCGRPARVRLNRDLTLREHLDHFVRFAPCGFAFHRIPRWISTGRQIHPDWYLGTDLDRSAGCARLSAALARQVWDFTAGPPTVVRVL